MAHGRPDFFGTPIHLKYGTTNVITDSKVGNLGIEKEIIRVDGCGVCLGGLVDECGNVPDESDMIKLYVDDVMIEAVTPIVLLTRGLLNRNYPSLQLSTFDPDAPRFSFTFSGDWSYEHNFSIGVIAANIGGVTVRCWAWYYEVK